MCLNKAESFNRLCTTGCDKGDYNQDFKNNMPPEALDFVPWLGRGIRL